MISVWGRFPNGRQPSVAEAKGFTTSMRHAILGREEKNNCGSRAARDLELALRWGPQADGAWLPFFRAVSAVCRRIRQWRCKEVDLAWLDSSALLKTIKSVCCCLDGSTEEVGGLSLCMAQTTGRSLNFSTLAAAQKAWRECCTCCGTRGGRTKLKLG